MRLIYAMTALGLVFASQASAQAVKTPDGMIVRLKNEGKVLTALGNECNGLPGYLIEDEGRAVIGYVTPDGEHIITGVCWGNSGELTKDTITALQIANMNVRQQNAQAKQNAAASAENVYVNKAYDDKQLMEGLEAGHQFSIGNPSSQLVYFVADPNCEHCHAAWADLKPLVASGQIHLKISLINARGNSREKILGILAQDNPGEAWRNGEGSTANTPVKAPPATNSKEYKEAEALFADGENFARTFRIPYTPFIAYKGVDEKVYVSSGRPSDLNAFLAGVKK